VNSKFCIPYLKKELKKERKNMQLNKKLYPQRSEISDMSKDLSF